jgi:hypothetical protein
VADFLKDYEPVEDRLRAFWSDHPNGRVMTTLISHADGHYIVFAEVWRSADDLPAASGLAHDSEAQLPSNMKTSALEVAETSAIGRALANLGYAAKGRRPSREEMSKASPAAGPAVTPTEGAATKGEDKQNPRGLAPNGDWDRQPSPAGGTSLAEGEAAGTEPGEGSSSLPSPGFPIDPSKCDHKTSSGRWVQWRMPTNGSAPVCPKCGTPKLVAMEGTTADLGPA